MVNVLRFMLGCCAVLLSASVFASKQVDVKEIRLWNAPDHSRLVLDLGDTVSHSLMTLQNPERVVIDIKGAKKQTRFDTLDLNSSPVKSIRSAVRNGSDLRIVLDMKGRVKPKSFLLAPNDQYGNRLVIDLYPKDTAQASKPVKKLVAM